MKLKTLLGWNERGIPFTQYAKPGEAVDDEIVRFFQNITPPIHLDESFFQSGEEAERLYDPRKGRFRSTFPTFTRHGIYWRYRGNCFYKEWFEPKSLKNAI